MPKVMIVDDDEGTRDTFSLILRTAGWEVVAAKTGREALGKLRVANVDVLLLDLRLPDMTGLDVLRAARDAPHIPTSVIMTAFGSVSSTVEAMRLGAVNYVEKPLIDEQVVNVAAEALSNAHAVAPASPEFPAAPCAQRWARMVVSATRMSKDPRTLEDWATANNVSVPTLKNRCRAVRLSAKTSLAFTRILRAVDHAVRFRSTPLAFLDADPRTSGHLLELAGIPSRLALEMPSSVSQLLLQQRLVKERSLLTALERALCTQTIEPCIQICVRCCDRT